MGQKLTFIELEFLSSTLHPKEKLEYFLHMLDHMPNQFSSFFYDIDDFHCSQMWFHT